VQAEGGRRASVYALRSHGCTPPGLPRSVQYGSAAWMVCVYACAAAQVRLNLEGSMQPVYVLR